MSIYLDAGFNSAESNLYPPAFAMLRAALEHHLFDRLLFLADRFEQDYQGVSEATWEQWQRNRPDKVLEWEWTPGKDGTVHVVWQGPYVMGAQAEDTYPLSIYYHYLERYDALHIPIKEFDSITVGHPVSKEDAQRIALAQKEIWRKALVWKELKDNLRLNELATEAELIQLDIHYRFLSAFAHPFSGRVVRAVYGDRIPVEAPKYDHYAAELVLLYVCYLSTAEIRTFDQMTERPPRVQVRQRSDLIAKVREVEELVSYFWPPGFPPHPFDKVQESNQRYFDRVIATGAAPPDRDTIVRPEHLSDDEVRYYDDPLRRLVKMHQSSTEFTTGISWISPWPRDDARFRA